jgi:hypothetical protein
MEKLADGLQKLNEDDLLQVVQMVHDNKSTDTYTKNDVESKLKPGCARSRNKLDSNTLPQTASSTSTSTPSPIPSSRCCGTSPHRRLSYRRGPLLAAKHKHGNTALLLRTLLILDTLRKFANSGHMGTGRPSAYWECFQYLH